MSSLGSFLLGKKNIDFTIESGKVSESSENTVTTTTQRGGNMSVTNSMGMTMHSQPTTRKYTTHSLEFWLTTDDGKEKKFNFKNCTLPMKNGHDATIIHANFDDVSFPCYLVNHNTGENTHISDPKESKLMGIGGWKFFGLAIAAFASSMYFFGSFGLSALLFFTLFPLIPIIKFMKFFKAAKKMDAYIKEKIEGLPQPVS